MDLRVKADQAVREALDHVHLPERAGAVERARVDARDQVGELLVVAGLRKPDVAQVKVEVEVRVLDPVRVIETERHLDQPPAIRRQQMNALVDGLADRVVERAFAEPSDFVERERADVAELAAGFHRQKTGVETGELLHGILEY